MMRKGDSTTATGADVVAVRDVEDDVNGWSADVTDLLSLVAKDAVTAQQSAEQFYQLDSNVEILLQQVTQAKKACALAEKKLTQVEQDQRDMSEKISQLEKGLPAEGSLDKEAARLSLFVDRMVELEQRLELLDPQLAGGLAPGSKLDQELQESLGDIAQINQIIEEISEKMRGDADDDSCYGYDDGCYEEQEAEPEEEVAYRSPNNPTPPQHFTPQLPQQHQPQFISRISPSPTQRSPVLHTSPPLLSPRSLSASRKTPSPTSTFTNNSAGLPPPLFPLHRGSSPTSNSTPTITTGKGHSASLTPITLGPRPQYF
ncbi:hypothetical protein Pelo_6059 [Pelomyxa schiedti]|nr:hypothetical protein Pelo_6059 [Pelomyxa schiedti]